jgi:ubiquinone/menaquinone biosynthesis C-methylase UbiE
MKERMILRYRRTDSHKYEAKLGYMSESVANTYDARRFRNFVGRLVDRLEKHHIMHFVSRLEKSKTILDAPCGTGRLFDDLIKFQSSVTGADVSSNMIAVASKRRLTYNIGMRPDLVICEIEHLPFRNRTFECVICLRLLAMIPASARIPIVQELRRVSNRYVIISFVNLLSLGGITRKTREFVGLTSDNLHSQTLASAKAELRTHALKPIEFRSALPYVSETCLVMAER